MDGPWGYYAEWNNSGGEKIDTIWFYLCVESKKQMNKQNKNKLTDTEKILVVTREEGKWGEDEMGEGDQLCGNGW